MRLLVLALLAVQWFGGAERNTREGAGHFDAGRLEEALRAFSRARAENPGAPETDLNLAGVHYRMGEDAAASGAAGAGVSREGGPLAEAARGYQAALAAELDDPLRRDAWFNLGNALYRAGAFPEAAQAFAEALAVDPEDFEARQNFERALRRAEEQDNEQESPESDPDGESDESPDAPEQQPDEQSEPESSDQDSSEPQGGDSEAPSDADRPPESPDADTSETPPDAESEPPREPPDPAPGDVPEVSPEQAERILAALAEVERAFQQDQLEKRRARALRRGRH